MNISIFKLFKYTQEPPTYFGHLPLFNFILISVPDICILTP